MIEIEHLSKTYRTTGGAVEALRDVSLTVPDGDIFGIIGMSGAGKSTLIRCINLLEQPSEGSIRIDGQELTTLTQAQRRAMQREIAMIFQRFHLLMQRNCLKNVCFPLELAGVKPAEAKSRALDLLELVGLRDKADAYPSQLSGGQQQRVAIARALASNPKVLLCDEATSALDPSTTNSILELIQNIHDRLGITVVIITHQMSVVERICRHVAILDAGQIVEQGEVAAVFSHPRSAAAKKLVFPEGNDAGLCLTGRETERFIRVVFNGAQATGQPAIARMAVEEGIEANIAYASTKRIGGRIYGSMILSLPDVPDMVNRAVQYLSNIPEISAEEVSFHAS